MASPYTQDINKTVQATRNQNKASYSEQLVGLFGKYVQKEQERAKENVKKLDTDFVFEKQKINANIKNYNKVLTLQETIRNEYNGSNEAYARAQVNNQYQQDVANHYNMQGKEGFQIFDDYTDVGTQDFLKARTANYTAKLDKMFTTAESINLGENVDTSYVDSLFTNQINNLPDSARGKGWSILGDLIAGQGLKVGNDYSVTRKDILDRVYSDIPNKELGSLGEDFKNLYTIDKGLAKQFRKEIVGNKKVGTSVNTVSSVATETFMGKEVRFRESYMTYIDENGRQQHTPVNRTALGDNELFIDPADMQGFIKIYSDQGKKNWSEMQTDGKSVSEIVKTLGKDLANFSNPDENTIRAAWANPQNTKAIKALYDDWSVQNGFAKIARGASFNSSVVVPVAGAADKEGYLTFDSYRKQEMNKSLDLLAVDGNQTPAEMGDSTAVVNGRGEPVGYVVEGKSYQSDDWQQTVNGTNPALTNDQGDMVTIAQYSITKLGLENPKLMDRLEAEYNKGDTTNVSKEGLYFNPDNPFILSVEELEALGMPEAVRPTEFGYNLETEDFVMRNARTLRDSNPEYGESSFNAFRIPGRYYLENAGDVIEAMDLESLSNEQLLTLNDSVENNLPEMLGLPEDVNLDRRSSTGLRPGPDRGDLFAEPQVNKQLKIRIRAELQGRFGGEGIYKRGTDTDAKYYMKSSKDREEIPSSWWADYFIGTPESTETARPGKKRGTKYSPKGN
tara:strand:- start:1198 stop:3399 length:2202 start_codon:yes stop_codon:yes gene_type:complete